EATGLGERGFASDKACQGRGQVAAACLASANRNVFVVGRRVGMERFVRCGVGCLPCARCGWREVLAQGEHAFRRLVSGGWHATVTLSGASLYTRGFESSVCGAATYLAPVRPALTACRV